MKKDIDILIERFSLPVATQNAKDYFLSGCISPVEGWANMTRFKRVIENLQGDKEVIDYTLCELDKYGKQGHEGGDYVMTQKEGGVRYDFSETNDSTLFDLYAQMDEIKAQIKEREDMLKHLPDHSEIVDTTTGEFLRRPVKLSKTTINMNFKK